MSWLVPSHKFVLVVALLLIATGCGDFKRLRECQRVANTANPVLERIDHLTEGRDGGVPSPAGYKRIIAEYATLEKQLMALGLTDEHVKNAVETYRDMLSDVRRELSKFSGKATPGVSLAQKRRSQRQVMAPVLHKEQVALQRLKNACKP